MTSTAQPARATAASEGRPGIPDCLVRHLGLFTQAAGHATEELLRQVRPVEVAAHITLYEANTAGQTILAVQHGLVKLVRSLPNGGERIVRLLRPGDTAGLERILDEPYRHTARTLTQAGLCRIPLGLLQACNRHDDGFTARLMPALQRYLGSADRFLTQLCTGTAQARVARLLLYLNETGAAEGFPSLGREELGDLLDVTTETASRVMADFRRRGLITETDGWVRQCNATALAAAATE